MLIQSEDYIKNPHVSVLILTYNQELYIRQCIDSVLEQVTDFAFEIIIGEDCGTDQTRNICIEYQKKFPEKIKLLLQDTNQGVIINYRDVLNLCSGKYIAQCGGDDYWCMNNKLQLQYEFLESKNEFGFLRTQGYALLENGNLIDATSFHDLSEGDVFEIAKYGAVGLAASIFFKAELLKYIDFDEFIRRNFSMEDYPMHAIFAKHTKFATIYQKCVVYRQVSNSISSNTNYDKKLKYLTGKKNICIYLSELYPDDFDINLSLLDDEIVYFKLKYAFKSFNLKEAKLLSKQITTNKFKKKKLSRLSNNFLSFYIGAIFYNL